MKKRLILFILFLIAIVNVSFSNLNNIQNKQALTIKLLSTYYTNGHYLINNFLKNSGTNISPWLRGGNDIYNLLYSIPIAVHETSHYYTKVGNASSNQTNVRATARSFGGRNTINFSRQTSYRTVYINIRKAPKYISLKRYKKILKGLDNEEDREYLKSVYRINKRFKTVRLTKRDKATKKRVLKILKRSSVYKPKRYVRNPDGSYTPIERATPAKIIYKIFIDKNKTYSFPLTKTFLTVNIASRIPEHLRKFRFSRYDTYINSASVFLGTQQYGIYGLFDEYTAFYYGTRTALNLVNYYKKKLPQTANTWRWFFKTVNWHYWSYYDFKYYMMQYLIYARSKYKKIYEKIKSNKPFIQAYKAMTDKWEKLMSDYAKLKIHLYRYLKLKGIRVYEGPEYSVVMKGRTRLGLLSFNFIIKRLKKELSRSIYRKLL